MTDVGQAPGLPDHFFRHEFGRLVAALVRRFGAARLEQCEDAVQTALMRAVHAWSSQGQPTDPSAWLYRVALNEVLGGLRRERRAEAALGGVALGVEDGAGAEDTVYLDHEVADGQLRMMFICGDPSLSRDSQLVFALKTLCGFSVNEIALRLFQTPEATYKRLQRARASLRAHVQTTDTPPVGELAARLPAVWQMIYLLFTEGYSSAQPDTVLCRELCDEAIRLSLILAQHPVGDVPETDALLALMYLDVSRFDAREDGAGGLLLLGAQDRSRWNRDLIARGMYHLERAARGDRLSRYHLEAGIAAEHCLAASYDETRWDEIARLYELLDRVAPSPINAMNRAIAVAERHGPEAGLAALAALTPPGWLQGYYLWDATLGELHRRAGHLDVAREYLRRARDGALTHAEQALLARRLAACDASA
ncbi:MAG: RNA polymerase subunit sigma-70 [Gemmatimonadetes bacterium]|nr:RNA polymerase subunit sigma-70 [Gemmatimonadota bacterium]